MSFSNILVATCMVASPSLSAQPSVDIALASAPTTTEFVDQANLITSWSSSGSPTEYVWYLPPGGSKVLTSPKQLASDIYQDGQTGVYRLYFPGSGLRMDLIVE